MDFKMYRNLPDRRRTRSPGWATPRSTSRPTPP